MQSKKQKAATSRNFNIYKLRGVEANLRYVKQRQKQPYLIHKLAYLIGEIKTILKCDIENII